MAADDLPYDALKKRYELEDLSASPVGRWLFTWLARTPGSTLLPSPGGKAFDTVLGWIRERYSADSVERAALLLDTVVDELSRVTRTVEEMCANMTREEAARRDEILGELFHDAIRKAADTRSRERVKRIAMILAGAATSPAPVDADEIEEMMRVAMNLGDQDVEYLRELVRIMGQIVGSQGRISRPTAHTKWEDGSWGGRVDPALDSAFSKLESFGLVVRVPPPNNLNISADFQNRYALLSKGLRFTQLVATAAGQSA
jgi:hypothetical protein